MAFKQAHSNARCAAAGIYTSASTSQCCSGFYAGANDGSLDYETIDAEI